MRRNLPNDVYTTEDLGRWGEVTRGIKPPIKLGVIGDPIAHSLSPQMHNAALEKCGIDMQYTRLHVTPDQLSKTLRLACENDFTGLNVTVPHKETASGLVDEMDEQAKNLAAVNTIAIRDRKLVGFNTDGYGFSRAVREAFSVDLKDLRVFVLGAGGVARAIAFECAKQNCERLVIANRDKSRADLLAKQLQTFFTGPRVLGPVARLQATALNEPELRSQIAHTDLMVNATSLGLERSDPTPIPAHLLEPHLMVFDTIYLPRPTPLLVAADQMGARSSNGASMLLYQGARAFEIWFGREAPLDVMRAALNEAVATAA